MAGKKKAKSQAVRNADRQRKVRARAFLIAPTTTSHPPPTPLI
jgi:hypothetical protein